MKQTKLDKNPSQKIPTF